MSNKELVQIASRALSLNLVVWSAANLAFIPSEAFSFFHYFRMQDRTSGQDYLLEYDALLVVCRLILCIGLFVASIWIYRCGPDIYRFLAPSEE
jgi:hypothetical protein